MVVGHRVNLTSADVMIMWSPGTSWSPEHSVRRLRVRMEVELGRGCDIADGLHVAAHDVEAGQPRSETWVCQQPDGEVSQRTQSHQGHLPRVSPGQSREHTDTTGVRGRLGLLVS